MHQHSAETGAAGSCQNNDCLIIFLHLHRGKWNITFQNIEGKCRMLNVKYFFLYRQMELCNILQASTCEVWSILLFSVVERWSEIVGCQADMIRYSSQSSSTSNSLPATTDSVWIYLFLTSVHCAAEIVDKKQCSRLGKPWLNDQFYELP